MERSEWVQRFAARIVERSNVPLNGASFIAEAAWYDRLAQDDMCDPEEAADDELAEWD